MKVKDCAKSNLKTAACRIGLMKAVLVEKRSAEYRRYQRK